MALRAVAPGCVVRVEVLSICVIGPRAIPVLQPSRVRVVVVSLFDYRGCRRGSGCRRGWLLATCERQTHRCQR